MTLRLLGVVTFIYYLDNHLISFGHNGLSTLPNMASDPDPGSDVRPKMGTVTIRDPGLDCNTGPSP